MAQFERELAHGWDTTTIRADHPFGADHHWCALLCGFSEAALEHGLLSGSQMEAIRPDLDACLPGLRACRQLLVVIPASREEHPRIVDLIRDGETLDGLRRMHQRLVKRSTRSRCLESSKVSSIPSSYRRVVTGLVSCARRSPAVLRRT